MYTYNIDTDITLYSYAELEVMKRIWTNKNTNKSSVPFRLTEIEKELELRNQK